MPERVSPAILPGSIADDRGRAFVETVRQALAEPDFRTLLFERIDDVPAAVLPHLVREFGVEDLVGADWPEANVRRILKDAWAVNAMRGTVAGIRRGLATLGIRLDIVQWYLDTPKGPPGTHRIRILATEHIWTDQPIITLRVLKAARRMIDGTKRWSQDEAIALGAEVAGAVAMAGAVARRVTVRRILQLGSTP